MMTLLQAHSLTGVTQFQPESMQLNLTERNSTATMTVGPDAPEMTIGDWVQDNTEPGEGIVWRVKTIETQYDREIRTVTLEHMIMSLQDLIMFGEVKPQDISGGTTCTAQAAIVYILARQSDWTLGDFGYSETNPYNFNGEDLYSAIDTVSRSLADSWWSYNFTVYPFVLNIQPKNTAVDVELREMRNIQTARMSIDKTRMYTRIYPIGKNNLHIDGEYISRNEDTYGRVDKTVTDQSKDSKAELYRWASETLDRHCEPTVTVTVQALDLSRETGEDLDRIVLGAMCRMPLTEYNTTVEETITKISYPDKIAEPERATVTLANIREDVASIVNQLIKSSGGGGRAAAKNAEEDHAWFVDTTDHVGMIAEGIAGEGAAEDWSRVAQLLVDGNGIHQRVQQAQADIVDAYSLIDQTTTAIRIEIGTVASEVRSFIETTPDMIHMEVGYAVSGFAQSVIEQTATYIRMEVSNAASAITGTVVEQTTEYVRTEVAAVASGVAWSVIEQTMTNIEQQIARKSKVYIQWEDPNNGTNVLYEGDVWIKRNNNKTWNEANAAGEKWNQSGVAWRRKYGDIQYVWKNGAWVLVKDFAVDVENEVRLEQTADGLALIGHAVDTQGQQFNSKLEVTAREIRSEVNTAKSALYSTIQQTATNIRAEVGNAVNGLTSVIEQTATQIKSEVANTKSEFYSRITQEANRISLVVEGTGANAHIKPAEIVASINNGASNIKLSADHIDIDGLVSKLESKSIGVGSLHVEGRSEFLQSASFEAGLSTDENANVNCGGIVIGDKGFRTGGYTATWKSKTVVTGVTRSSSRNFVYAVNGNISNLSTIIGTLVTGVTSDAIYYLGR